MARVIHSRNVITMFALVIIAASVGAQPARPPGPSPAAPSGGGGSNTNPTCNTDGSSANIAFSTSGTNRVITTNQCPNHAIRTINPNAARQSSSFGVTDQQYPLPLAPTLAPTAQIVNVTCVGGTVGFMRTGAVVYSVFPGTCGGDAVTAEGGTFDECGGHSDQSNTYHYHMTPSCALSSYTTSSTAHSPILGYMVDGIPLYGPLTDGGAVPSDLDSCGGHSSDSGNGGHYHYHLKPIMGTWPDPSTPLTSASTAGAGWPYTPGCLRGCIPDMYLSTLKNLGVTQQTSYSSCTAAGTVQAQAESIATNSAGVTTTTTAATATTTAPTNGSPTTAAGTPTTTTSSVQVSAGSPSSSAAALQTTVAVSVSLLAALLRLLL